MRAVIAIVTLMLAGTPALAENIFIHSRSQVSNRLAILEDDKRVALSISDEARNAAA